MLTDFTPLASFTGGMLIGLSAVLLMALNGRIAGMTGILDRALFASGPDARWRRAFLAGALLAPGLAMMMGARFDFAAPTQGILLAAGGVIVGVGVTLGSGCPSGHGVCGIARLSPRSIIATATFMLTTGLTVFVMRHVVGV